LSANAIEAVKVKHETCEGHCPLYKKMAPTKRFECLCNKVHSCNPVPEMKRAVLDAIWKLYRTVFAYFTSDWQKVKVSFYESRQ
jgi:hypothetical protein